MGRITLEVKQPRVNHYIANKTTIEDKKTYFLETSAFLTGVNIIEKGPKKIDENIPKAAEINNNYAKINEKITVRPRFNLIYLGRI